MARDPNAEPVYQVAEAFKERCLRNGLSLLWPDVPAWSVENIDAVYSALMGAPETGAGQAFSDGFRARLDHLPLDAHRIAADARVMWYLIADTGDVRPGTKKGAVNYMIGWKIGSDPQPPGWPAVDAAFDIGVSRVEGAYIKSRILCLAYIVKFASEVRRDPKILDDEPALIALANRVQEQVPSSIGMRHALLHLLMPDRFEPIVINGHKYGIALGFPQLRGSSGDIDDQLLAIRQGLAPRFPDRYYDFYDPEIQPIWRKAVGVDHLRKDIERIRNMVESAVPDVEARTIALRLIADGILAADEVRGSSWSLGLTGSSRLRLYVAWVGAATLDKTGLSLVIDMSAVSADTVPRVEALIDPARGRHPYPSLPEATEVTIPYQELAEIAPLVGQGSLAFIRDAASQVRTRSHRHDSHRPAAVHYLEEELGMELPQPDYPPLPDTARWWIEQTQSASFPYRQEGPFAVGRAMVFPPPGAKQIQFTHPTDVQPGDVVLHFENGAAFTGTSRVERPLETDEIELVPAGLDWAVSDGRIGVIPLTDHRRLDPPLNRPAVFDHLDTVERLRALDPEDIRGAFFRLDSKPGPNGHYHTPVHPALLDVLRDAYRREAGKELVPEGWPMPEDVIVRPPENPLADLARRTHMTADELQQLRELLDDKRQLILEGPPGSGKTFVADLLARWIAGASFDGDAGDRVEIVQFHQSYGYEDFVQGIRPVTDGGVLAYEMKPGIFLEMCDRARANPDERHVLIIDEINRGNLSRIFGELLMALEYRERAVRLASGDTLAIPGNLLIVGTMNSTDRSLALIDYALRRRFHFRRLEPVANGQAPVLQRWLEAQDVNAADARRVLALFLALNAKIGERLSPDFQVGHSYFMRPDIVTPTGRERVWNHGVMPLLAEYFHGARDREQLLEEFSLKRLEGIDCAAPEAEFATEDARQP